MRQELVAFVELICKDKNHFDTAFLSEYAHNQFFPPYCLVKSWDHLSNFKWEVCYANNHRECLIFGI